MTNLPLSVLTHPLPALCTEAPGLRPRLGVRDHIADPYGVALTFDDGPDPRGTPQVLHLLEAMGVLATFFVTGEQVRVHPSVAADVVAAGHEIAVKGDRHRNVLRVSSNAARRPAPCRRRHRHRDRSPSPLLPPAL
jgi:hypothetical protein